MEAARNDRIWDRAKAIVTKEGVGLGLAVLKQVLIDLALDAVR